MWWQPRNDREFALARAMEQLRGWFKDQPSSREDSICWGFGTAFSRGFAGIVPVVLLNDERFPYPFLTHVDRMDGREAIEPVPIEAVREPNIPAGIPQTYPPLHYVSVAEPRASSVTEELFDSVLSVRDSVVCGRTGEMGTAGVLVRASEYRVPCLLTAGHVFPMGVGSPVLRARWWLLVLRWTIPLGNVVRHIVPVGSTPGWDAAVIRVDKHAPMSARVVTNQVRHFEHAEAVVAYGAFSGPVRNAQTHGGLVVLRGSGCSWKNCWMTAPTGILTNGDSGAAVFTRREQKFLGIYIGQSTVGGRITMHYVQDSYTLRDEVLKAWNIEF